MVYSFLNSEIELFIFIYSFVLLAIYTLLSIFAVHKFIKYKRQSVLDDNYLILNSPIQPSISVIASAYNEAVSIIDCVGALLRLEYDNYEVIVVNDGSVDETLELLIKKYDLYMTDETVEKELSFKDVRGVYRSRGKHWYSLMVIDKVNGGKADAINCGVSKASGEYIINIDVDSILLPDSLVKLILPVLKSDGKSEVIAVGAGIGVANNCVIDNGVIVSCRVPENTLLSIQVIEYARAFFLGRIGWSELNMLMIISGAIGLFRRDIVISIGGYNVSSIGEDMELIVRARRILYDAKIDHRIEFVPDVLLWTEVPSSLRMLYRQRVRWTKGLISSLLYNKKMFLNPRYGRIGMVAFPFWVFYEWFAPIMELLGFIYFIVVFFTIGINWIFLIFLTVFIFLFGGVFSTVAIFMDQLAAHSYGKRSDLLKLILRGLTEPFFYHVIITYSAIVGNIEYILGKRHNWGKMTRKGFSVKP